MRFLRRGAADKRQRQSAARVEVERKGISEVEVLPKYMFSCIEPRFPLSCLLPVLLLRFRACFPVAALQFHASDRAIPGC